MSINSNKEMQLSEITLQINNDNIQTDSNSYRQPKRILHFSDGDLLEYSDDDDDDNTDASQENRDLVDPINLDWASWAWYRTSTIGSKILEGCDYVGEALADFLGITSPKYLFEINEYNRLQKLEADERSREISQMETWAAAAASSSSSSTNNTTSNINNQSSLIINDVKSGGE